MQQRCEHHVRVQLTLRCRSNHTREDLLAVRAVPGPIAGLACAATITGTARITFDADFGASGVVCLDGATLQFGGSTLVTNRPFVLDPVGATLNAFFNGNDYQVTLNGPISGPGGLT